MRKKMEARERGAEGVRANRTAHSAGVGWLRQRAGERLLPPTTKGDKSDQERTPSAGAEHEGGEEPGGLPGSQGDGNPGKGAKPRAAGAARSEVHRRRGAQRRVRREDANRQSRAGNSGEGRAATPTQSGKAGDRAGREPPDSAGRGTLKRTQQGGEGADGSADREVQGTPRTRPTKTAIKKPTETGGGGRQAGKRREMDARATKKDLRRGAPRERKERGKKREKPTANGHSSNERARREWWRTRQDAQRAAAGAGRDEQNRGRTGWGRPHTRTVKVTQQRRKLRGSRKTMQDVREDREARKKRDGQKQPGKKGASGAERKLHAKKSGGMAEESRESASAKPGDTTKGAEMTT